MERDDQQKRNKSTPVGLKIIGVGLSAAPTSWKMGTLSGVIIFLILLALMLQALTFHNILILAIIFLVIDGLFSALAPVGILYLEHLEAYFKEQPSTKFFSMRRRFNKWALVVNLLVVPIILAPFFVLLIGAILAVDREMAWIALGVSILIGFYMNWTVNTLLYYWMIHKSEIGKEIEKILG